MGETVDRNFGGRYAVTCTLSDVSPVYIPMSASSMLQN